MNTRGTLFALFLALLLPAGTFALPEGSIQTASPQSHALPEPTTIALMVIGLVGLCIARRRSSH
jgi:hypothetical protein